MPAQDPEGQFKFLLMCIKHSVAGKINFEAVAHELGIVSKAAAAKRYERLLKAHNIGVAPARGGGGGGGGGEGSGRAAPRVSVPRAAKTKGTRKRKAKEEDEEAEEEEEEEGGEPSIKEEEEYGSPNKKSKIVSALQEEDEWDDQFL